MRLLILPVAVILAACDQQKRSAAPIEEPTVSPSAPASLVSVIPSTDERTLRFRLRAPPGHPLYLENCNGAFSWGLEHQVEGVWKPAWIVATNACHSAPIVVRPGETREFTEAVSLGAGESLPADTYRVAVYGLYSTHHDEDHSASTEVPHELRLSEPFQLGPLAGP